MYTLTPDGFSHRMSLISNYVHRFLDHYQNVRQTLRDELEPLALNAESKIAIYGTEGFAELVYLGLKEIGIEDIDVFDIRSAPGRLFLGMPVREITGLQPENYHRVVIAKLEPNELLYEQLRERQVSSQQVVTFFTNGRTMESG